MLLVEQILSQTVWIETELNSSFSFQLWIWLCTLQLPPSLFLMSHCLYRSFQLFIDILLLLMFNICSDKLWNFFITRTTIAFQMSFVMMKACLRLVCFSKILISYINNCRRVLLIQDRYFDKIVTKRKLCQRNNFLCSIQVYSSLG